MSIDKKARDSAYVSLNYPMPVVLEIIEAYEAAKLTHQPDELSTVNPCEVCGSRPVITKTSPLGNYSIECKGHLVLGFYHFEEQAVEAWNASNSASPPKRESQPDELNDAFTKFLIEELGPDAFNQSKMSFHDVAERAFKCGWKARPMREPGTQE